MNRQKYFADASFYRKAIKIALPVMLQMLIQNLVSLIDNFMVSGLGDIKMSGVNIAGQILFVFMVFLNTICMAGGIFMTQYSGAKNEEGMQQALRFKLIMGGLAIILYLFVCMGIPRQILSLMVMGNSQADLILDQSQQYMFLMGYMGLPVLISSAIASSLREIGQVKAPLFISIFATCVNTFLNWVLIYGNLGAPRLEVRGAAYASIVARCVEMALFLLLVLVKKPPFAFRLHTLFHVDIKLFFRILQKGSMMLGSEMLWVISETVTTALYNGRGGADVVSGMASSFAIANLFFVSFGGITTATGVIIGQSLGSGDLEEAKRQKNWMLTAAFIFGIFMGIMGMLTRFLIPIVFANLSISAQSICDKMVMMMSLFMPVWVYVNAQFAVSRAGGDTMMGMLVDGVTTILLILPGIFFIALCTNLGPVMMYMMVKSVDFLKVLCAHWWLKKERWVKNLAVSAE